jgi:hypothetical protein
MEAPAIVRKNLSFWFELEKAFGPGQPSLPSSPFWTKNVSRRVTGALLFSVWLKTFYDLKSVSQVINSSTTMVTAGTFLHSK